MSWRDTLRQALNDSSPMLPRYSAKLKESQTVFIYVGFDFAFGINAMEFDSYVLQSISLLTEIAK